MPAYGGPSDALLSALAQAEAQPSRAYRAVATGAQAGQDILGGYMQGKQIQQQLEQYKLLNTPLGSMYPDQSQIPFGLGPQHTVKDLLTIAPAMENFAPANLMSGVGSMYGANVAPAGNSRAPTQAPSPTIASTSMAPIAGAEQSSSGPANLSATEGTGAPQSPTLNIPAGGMGMGAFQKVVIPALNAAREGRQFQQGQASENERARLSREQQERNFQESQGNEKNRAIAAQQDEFNKSSVRQMGGFDALSQLTKALQTIPLSQTGPITGALTKHAGSMASGTAPDLSSYNQIREGIIGNFAAALDPMGRQNVALLRQIENIAPTVQDIASSQQGDYRAVNNKIKAMYGMLSSAVNRNYEGYNSAAQQIGGNITPPKLPPLENYLYKPPTAQANPDDQAALQWLQQNPNDPKASAISAKLRGKGVLR